MIEIIFEDGEKMLVPSQTDADLAEIDFVETAPGRLHIIKNNNSYSIEFVQNLSDADAPTLVFSLNGKRVEVGVCSQTALLLKKMGISSQSISALSTIKAPMPGLIFQLMAAPGQVVEAGEPLLVLEAMKMENVIKTSAGAKIKKVHVALGQKVEKGQILIEFES